MRFLVVFLMMLFSNYSFSQSGCTPQNTSDQETLSLIDKLIGDTSVYKRSSTSTFDQLYTLKRDLTCLAELKSNSRSSELHRQIFGGDVDGRVYIRWLAKRVTHFQSSDFVQALAVTAGGVGDYLLRKFFPINRPGVVTLGPRYFDNDNSYDAISTLLHEGRHTEGYKHYGNLNSNHTCRDEYYCLARELEPKTDEYVDHDPLGPYGVQIIFGINVAKHCINCVDFLMKELKERSLLRMGRISSSYEDRQILIKDLL